MISKAPIIVIALAMMGALTTLKMIPYGQKTIKDTTPDRSAKKIKTTNICAPGKALFSLHSVYAFSGIIFPPDVLPPTGAGDEGAYEY